MIEELGDRRIHVLDPEQHRQLARVAVRESPSLEVATIRGNDDPAGYDRATFALVRKTLGRKREVQDEMRHVEEVWPPGDPRILMIDRGPSHPFYKSEQSESKSSGNERRSIPNFSEIHRSVQRRHRACLSVMPETLTLARQFALFATADVIIAQTGAALANMIWARPSATVIVIFPDDERTDYFRDLALCLGLRYRRFRQDHSHAEVDPDELAAFVDHLLDHPDLLITPHLRRISFRALRRVTVPWARTRSFSHRVIKRFA
jgi:hypothetical protein